MAHVFALSFPLLAAATPADLLAARSQMALTLGFHIVLACLGVALAFEKATKWHTMHPKMDWT